MHHEFPSLKNLTKEKINFAIELLQDLSMSLSSLRDFESRNKRPTSQILKCLQIIEKINVLLFEEEEKLKKNNTTYLLKKEQISTRETRIFSEEEMEEIKKGIK